LRLSPALSQPRKGALISFALLLTLGFAWYVSREPMDFRVYYFGAQGVFDGTRPVYGINSGMGWPMHYRYPPPFLFIAKPFTRLTMSWAAAIWTILKCGALILLIQALWKRLGPAESRAAWLIPLLLAGPYVVEDLRYGNAQSFIFALTGAALLILTTAPLLAAGVLAIGIVVKVWPLFFLPYLAVRRQWKVVGWSLVFAVILLLLPALHFGFSGNLDLLSQWARQEFATQTGQAEIWFPSQSLRGVMMRFLTVIDYSQVPDPNYPLVHVMAMDPSTIRLLWMVLAGMGYLGLLVVTARRQEMFGLTEALAFTCLVLLQPFSQKYALVVLLWPAMVAGRLYGRNPVRILLYAASALALVQPLIIGSAAQRLLQVLGFDFLATALLAAFLVTSILAPSIE
jgi:Glycosyltransferase family 87